MQRICLAQALMLPAILCLLAGALPARAAAPAAPEVRVVHLPAGALVPDVAMDAQGALHMVYGLNGCAWYVRSTDDGKTFTAPVKVNGASPVTLRMGERGPKIALGKDGAIHVAWGDQWAPGVKVFPRHSRSLDGGKSFEAPKALSSIFGIDGLTLAADAEGNVLAFFHHVTPGQNLGVPEAHHLYMARSTDNGATFAEAEQVNIQGATGLACSMCMMRARIGADGSAYLAYRSATDNVRDFYVLKSPKGENAFTPLRVNEDNWVLPKCPMCGPELTFDAAGRALCAFMSRHRVYWSALDGGRFTLHAATPAPEEDEIYPAAFGNGRGSVLLVWQVGPMAVGKKATVKWAVYGEDGAFTGRQGTVGISDSGTKATAFVGKNGNFNLVTTAR